MAKAKTKYAHLTVGLSEISRFTQKALETILARRSSATESCSFPINYLCHLRSARAQRQRAPVETRRSARSAYLPSQKTRSIFAFSDCCSIISSGTNLGSLPRHPHPHWPCYDWISRVLIANSAVRIPHLVQLLHERHTERKVQDFIAVQFWDAH
jgi:hypothetical protein